PQDVLLRLRFVGTCDRSIILQRSHSWIYQPVERKTPRDWEEGQAGRRRAGVPQEKSGIISTG
ncbi:hypothetical protein FQA47_017233, partial [Oryzias melastigma]